MIRRIAACGLSVLAASVGSIPHGLAGPRPTEDCRSYAYGDQRVLLVRKLQRDGYSAEQSKFLMWLSDLKTAGIKEGCLSAEGRQCGVGSIKGMMLECTRASIDEIMGRADMTPASPGLDEMKPSAQYGRTQFAVRELIALAAMEACSASAKERFFSLPQQGDCLMDMNATPP